MAACTECIHQAKIVSHRWGLLGIGSDRIGLAAIRLDYVHSQAHIINCTDACNGPPWKIIMTMASQLDLNRGKISYRHLGTHLANVFQSA